MSRVKFRPLVVAFLATATIAGASGHLQLNVFKPVIAHAVLQSIRLLADASTSFARHCVEGIEPDRVLDLLAALVDKSLVVADERDGATRYRMLETLRQYAGDRLRELHDEALRLEADRRVGRYVVEVENFESIHNHSAYARIERREHG